MAWENAEMCDDVTDSLKNDEVDNEKTIARENRSLLDEYTEKHCCVEVGVSHIAGKRPLCESGILLTVIICVGITVAFICIIPTIYHKSGLAYINTTMDYKSALLHINATDSTIILQRNSTGELTETFSYQQQMDAIRFNVTNSYITSYSGTSSSALVFRRSGRYNVNLLVVYDEGYCRPHSPPEGKIHLTIVKAADLSKVGKVFSEAFSRRPGKNWMVYGRINAQVKMRQGQGLLIYTDHRECIKQTDTHLSVTKLQNQNIT